MKLSLSFIMALLILGFGFTRPAFRQSDVILTAPRLLNYQGFLTDTLGNRFTGEATMKISICDAIVAGRTLWTEVITNVPIDRGIFNVVLGNLTPIPESVFYYLGDRWLEVSVNSFTFVPRTHITASPTSMEALRSKTAGYALAIGKPDSDWVVGTGTLDSTLMTGHRLGISRGDVGNVSYDSYQCTHMNLGVACTTGTNGGNTTYLTILGGYGNRADLNGSTIAGGARNRIRQFFSFIGGGYGNVTYGNSSAIAGGYNDTVYSPYGGILSGIGNATGNDTTYGKNDTAVVVLGGSSNRAYGGWSSGSNFALIGNGKGNSATALCATIINGQGMQIYDSWEGIYSTGINGVDDSLYGGYSIGSGLNDWLFGFHQSMLTGMKNWIGYRDWGVPFGEHSVICGGYDNGNTGDYCFIGNGKHQEILHQNSSPKYTAIGGGSDNSIADDPYATIGGGYSGGADWFGAKLGGCQGWAGSISFGGGGYSNSVGYDANANVGGYGNDMQGGKYSFAANNQSACYYHNAAVFNGQTVDAAAETRVGIIAKGSGAFSIDHPLDPGYKILNHYFAESPEMVLMYRGIAKIGTAGWVEVRLPDFFDKLNKNPMVKLTGVGTSDVHIAERIKNNRFVIRGPAGAEVHWLVTGDRRDPSSDIIRILKPVEQEKGEALAGRSMDDNFLRSSLPQLEQMGKDAGFEFRYPVNRKRYEDSKRDLKEAIKAGADGREGRQP
jgi:hypothetical protein